MKTKFLIFVAFCSVSLLLIFLPSSAMAAINNYSNNTFGSIDSIDPDFEIRTLNVPTSASIIDVNIAVDFHAIDGNDCNNPGTGNGFAGEVAFQIVSPQGTTVLLVSNDFTGGDTYEEENAPRVTVTFDDAAADLVGTTNAGLPENGTFRPVGALSAFNGENPNGTWEFRFQDDTGGDWLCFYGVTLTIEDADEAAGAIPTLSEWGMIIFALVLAGSAFWYMRREVIV